MLGYGIIMLFIVSCISSIIIYKWRRFDDLECGAQDTAKLASLHPYRRARPVHAAAQTVSDIIAAGLLPAALEMMDRLSAQAAEAAVIPTTPSAKPFCSSS